MHSLLRSLQFVTIATCLLFAAPQAHAGFAFTAPATQALIAPGQPLKVGFHASCPVGKTCGSWQGYNTFGTVEVRLDHATPNAASRVFGSTWAQAPITETGISLRGEDYITAGNWKLTAQWAECPTTPNPHDRLTETDCSQETFTRNLGVRAQVGTRSTPPNPQVSGHRTLRNRMHTDLYFMCNAPAKSYRVDHIIQQQVQVGGKLRWVPLSRLTRNLRVTLDTESNGASRCIFRRQFTIPRSVKTTTKLRARYVVRTVSFKPAAVPRAIHSREVTRGSLSSSGSIVIG